MLYLTCTTISSVDLAQYGVPLVKDKVSVECGTNLNYTNKILCKNNRLWRGQGILLRSDLCLKSLS